MGRVGIGMMTALLRVIRGGIGMISALMSVVRTRSGN